MSDFTALDVGDEKEKEVGGDDMAMSSDRDLTGGRLSLGSWGSNSILETVQNSVKSVFADSKPWGEFANTKNMSMPSFSDLRDRVIENFKYYKSNYAVILLVLSAFAILSNPLSLLGLAMVALGYFYMFMYSQSNLKIAGFELDTSQKKTIALVMFGCVIFWVTGAGATFSTLLTTVGIFGGLHAALKRSPNEADFETSFSPSAV
uniref:PRA1 family protein n=1 Tax=Rhodosorus marinus TaxID=101924 RepID=A0A7S3A142_9RHOD|mmetsp:Transcript_38042/g.151080  ORF Transcript_38042/g.151080 Transcript_38042/m.151080 type:complete len:205 (+) Transcript_38042:161-775(+)